MYIKFIFLIWIAVLVLESLESKFPKNIFSSSSLQDFKNNNTKFNYRVVYDNNAFVLDRSDKFTYKIYTAPPPSIGSVFPQPTFERYKKNYLILSSDIKFVLNSVKCNLPKLAINRYYNRIIRDKQVTRAEFNDLDKDTSICHHHNEKNCQINSIMVAVTNCKENDVPSENMIETYKLTVEERTIILEATETWGVLRGLETLAQMVVNVNINGKQWLFIQEVFIKDEPKYVHRGLMIDTARHYITVDKILENLDMMEMNKMNVFHWHMTDDQSFPFKGMKHPDLAMQGAFDNKSVYDANNIRKVVEYARVRGIRVIPEIDLPGHVLSWSNLKPNMVIKCFKNDLSKSSMLNINLLEVLDLISDLYSDLILLFPDKYIHIGFDDISLKCLKQNHLIEEHIRKENSTYNYLIKAFLLKIQKIIKNKNPSKTLVLWYEISEKNYLLDSLNNSIIQLHKDSINSMDILTKFKGRIIYSTDFYLDRVVTGVNWLAFYKSDFGKYFKTSILGAEATIWTEFQSIETITSNIWPTACGLAELLWKGQGTNYLEIGSRIEEQRCRMLRRGYLVGVAGGAGECKYLSRHSPKISVRVVESSDDNYSTPKVLTQLMIFYFGLFIGFGLHKGKRYKLYSLVGITIFSLIFLFV